MTTVFGTPAELKAAEGQHLGYSDWLEITQDRIDKFADATGDHQWIHVDPERAKDGPFGACIAHGYLTQSLVNMFLPQIVEVRGISMGVNYGADKVRFPAPVPVGSRAMAWLGGHWFGSPEGGSPAAHWAMRISMGHWRTHRSQSSRS